MEQVRSKLNELVDLKAPGVSGSRIRALQQLATNAAGSHDAAKIGPLFVDWNFTCPVTHKLGALYAFDAVARSLADEQKKTASPSPALESLENSLEAFMKDLKIRHQSPDNFDKMSKVLQIWQKAETFSTTLLSNLKSQYFYTPYTRSPPGSPGPNYFWGGLEEELPKPKSPSPPAATTAPAVNAASVLATLANLAKTSNSPQPSQAEIKQPSLLDQLMANAPKSSPLPAQAEVRGRSAQSSDRTRDRSRSPNARPRDNDRGGRGTNRPEPKILEIDESLVPTNSIKVLSRTLFVGNIPSYMDDRVVRKAVDDVCPVQSLVFNKEKRHAFIKVYTRDDAVAVRETWEQRGRTNGFELRARWGVGYGPRDCFDYSRGVSIIPIDRLTEADIRWALTAANGGTNNVPLAGGQVIEEPDIEVGGGLSSRVINKKAMPGMPMMPMMPGMAGVPPGAPQNGQFPMMFPGMMPGMPGMPGMPFPFMPGQDMSNTAPGAHKPKEDA